MALSALRPTDGRTSSASCVPSASRTPSALRASRLAREVHAGQSDGYGEPVLEHVARVAARVPAAARPVALVHDVPHRSALSAADVAFCVGLDADERRAVELLVPVTGEDDVAHVARIAAATPSRGRDIALAVKRADVADHTDRAPHCHTSAHARAAATLDALVA